MAMIDARAGALDFHVTAGLGRSFRFPGLLNVIPGPWDVSFTDATVTTDGTDLLLDIPPLPARGGGRLELTVDNEPEIVGTVVVSGSGTPSPSGEVQVTLRETVVPVVVAGPAGPPGVGWPSLDGVPNGSTLIVQDGQLVWATPLIIQQED